MLEVGRKVVVRDGAKIIFIGELISVTNCRFAHQISDNSIVWNDVRIASIDGNRTPAGTGTFWGPRERKEFLAENVSHPGPDEEQAATSPALTLGQIGEQIVADAAARRGGDGLLAVRDFPPFTMLAHDGGRPLPKELADETLREIFSIFAVPFKPKKKPVAPSFKNLGVHLMSLNDGFAGTGKTTWIGYAVLAFVCAVVAFSIAAWAA